MGATTFITVGKGETSQDAFNKARIQARHEYGHNGYTGTIAEKQTFIEVKLPAGADANKLADQLVNTPRFEDKYGPAGCFKLSDDLWMFFGWAAE